VSFEYFSKALAHMSANTPPRNSARKSEQSTEKTSDKAPAKTSTQSYMSMPVMILSGVAAGVLAFAAASLLSGRSESAPTSMPASTSAPAASNKRARDVCYKCELNIQFSLTVFRRRNGPLDW
jgi:hypothetical protein